MIFGIDEHPEFYDVLVWNFERVDPRYALKKLTHFLEGGGRNNGGEDVEMGLRTHYDKGTNPPFPATSPPLVFPQQIPLYLLLLLRLILLLVILLILLVFPPPLFFHPLFFFHLLPHPPRSAPPHNLILFLLLDRK